MIGNDVMTIRTVARLFELLFGFENCVCNETNNANYQMTFNGHNGSYRGGPISLFYDYPEVGLLPVSLYVIYGYLLLYLPSSGLQMAQGCGPGSVWCSV